MTPFLYLPSVQVCISEDLQSSSKSVQVTIKTGYHISTLGKEDPYKAQKSLKNFNLILSTQAKEFQAPPCCNCHQQLPPTTPLPPL